MRLSSIPPLWVGLTGFICFATLGALIKLLRLDLDPLSLIAPWLAMNAFVMGLWIYWRSGWSGFKTKIISIHLIRGVIMCLPFLGGVYALHYVSLSLYSTLLNTSPFFLILLASFWLNESVSPRIWLAVALGFIGVLVCLKPGWESFSWFLLAPLLAAMSHAVGNAWLRRYPDEPESRWVFYQELSGCTVAGILLWATGGTLPEYNHLVLMGSMVGIDILAMTTVFFAFKRMESSRIAPWIYIQIPASAIAGWILFDEIPAWTTAVGAVLIILGGSLALSKKQYDPQDDVD
ncbi:MAG: DMT family transporter [Deltaproteobacteria bacterium]